ncbi:hypothetical protein [Pedobacter sp. Leaf170]|uniref:hypothetical protein n=1 Tax=Pedobacter sp. Leaf170 TaxID=2876558 RepID=UPI001E370730|nr:hypothetical protein [Pedobacter sp. Leaf170]
MRLFTFLLFVLIFGAIAGFASQKKTERKFKSSSFTVKKITTVNNQSSDTGTLQKDFITTSQAYKVSNPLSALLLLIAFLQLTFKIKIIKIFFNKLELHFRCLFKILYPKHVFW